MIAYVENPITNGEQRAYIEVKGHKVHVKCIDTGVEFVCEPVEGIDEQMLNWIFSEKHTDWKFGLNSFKILEANVKIVQSSKVEEREFVEEMRRKYSTQKGK